MKQHFHSIYSYHHKTNALLLKELELHLEQLPERALPMFSHILFAHELWLARLLGLDMIDLKEDHTLNECQTLNEILFIRTIAFLSIADFQKKITYKDSLGSLFESSVSDVLFHISNHTAHHRGMLISDFRNSGIVPLTTDYIFSHREKLD